MRAPAWSCSTRYTALKEWSRAVYRILHSAHTLTITQWFYPNYNNYYECIEITFTISSNLITVVSKGKRVICIMKFLKIGSTSLDTQNDYHNPHACAQG